MLVITKDILMEEVLGNLIKGKEWYYDITAAVVYIKMFKTANMPYTERENS